MRDFPLTYIPIKSFDIYVREKKVRNSHYFSDNKFKGFPVHLGLWRGEKKNERKGVRLDAEDGIKFRLEVRTP
jgi:hypothetical protein